VGTGLTVAAVTVSTVGQTVGPLKALAVLAPRRPDVGPQGLPINRSAAQAKVTETALDPNWSLEIVGPAGTRRLGRAALLAMPQHEAVLPIACVEGWSASARWSGVRIADLVALADGSEASAVGVTSLEERGAYRLTELPAAYARHPDTLLALRIDGEDLDIEHGFPARIMAPNRPGVLQTKWVARLEVRGG
jgi:DMSO/TMAO reductase YedYZ molybdopterin-dependent catalytic subunit